MYVEKVGALLDHAEQIADMSIDKHTSADVIKAKIAASEMIPGLRAALYPEDEDD